MTPFRDRKVADLYEVVFRVPRTDVLQISRRQRRASGWGALAGGIAAMSLGFRAGLELGFNPAAAAVPTRVL